MQVRTVTELATVPAETWNALDGTDNPFLRHEFLVALEHHGAAAPRHGWQPMHLLLENDQGELLAASPTYLKANSWGEFVFDWSWAHAFERAGLDYYPKLLMAVPYTPVSGPRVLVRADQNADDCIRQLWAAAEILCSQRGLSSAHCLFPTAAQAEAMRDAGWLERVGCQFHWRNQRYASFNDFLDTLSNKKRKNIRRERRLAAEAGLQFAIVSGDRVAEGDWSRFHAFYERTFEEHGNLPVLSAGFFRDIGKSLGAQVLMVQAHADGQLVGAALLLRSSDTLFGRYWGCESEFPGMHFETCYYQGIEYCIREGLEWFEPGAQGEHKVARGFLPRQTRSLHWIDDERFRVAVGDFLRRETGMVHAYMDEMAEHSPYKSGLGPEVG